MSNDQLSVSDVINSEVQVASRLWTQAFNTLTICPKTHLKTKTDGGSTYLLTRGVAVSLGDNSYNFSVAALVDAKRPKVTDSSQLFLVIDENVIVPAFTLGKRMLDKAVSSTYDFREVAPGQIEKIIGIVRDSVSGWKTEADRVMQRAERDKADSRETFWRRVKISGAIVGVPAIIAGGIVGFVHWSDVQDREEAAVQMTKVQEYDMKNVVLHGSRVNIGDTNFAINDPQNIADPSVPNLGSINDHVRSQNIQAGQCMDVGHIESNRFVLVASDAPAQNVMASVNDAGDVSVCATPNRFATTKDSKGQLITPTYEVLIQSQIAAK